MEILIAVAGYSIIISFFVVIICLIKKKKVKNPLVWMSISSVIYFIAGILNNPKYILENGFKVAGVLFFIHSILYLFAFLVKKKPVKIPLIGAVISVILFVTGILLYKEEPHAYDAAVSMMEAGKYEEAKNAFTALGQYLDSGELAEQCQKNLDYNEAVSLMDARNYESAKAAFLKLGDFKDSTELAVQCQNTIDYENAKGQMESGDLESAKQAFLELGQFKDSAAMAIQCQDTMDYNQAESYMEKEDYKSAKDIFSRLGDFKDSGTLLEKCNTMIVNADTYKKAAAAYKEKEYYKAYKLFISLENYSDSAKRASKCVQEYPDTKVLYKNKDYNFNYAPLRFINNDTEPVYIKIYTTKGKYVSSLFINEGDTLEFNMPKGNFYVKYAAGTNWFGKKDMFGEEGSYNKFEETFDFNDYGLGYEVSFKKVLYGNLESEQEDMEGF